VYGRCLEDKDAQMLTGHLKYAQTPDRKPQQKGQNLVDIKIKLVA